MQDTRNILLIMKNGDLIKDMLETPDEIPADEYPFLTFFPSDM